jgi:cytochrome P450
MTIWTCFSSELRSVVAASTEEAGRRGCDEVAVEHLLIAGCKNTRPAVRFVLEKSGIQPAVVLEKLAAIAPSGSLQRQRAARLSSAALHLLDVAAAESERMKSRRVGTEHLLVALMVIDGGPAGELLRDLGLTREKLGVAIGQWRDCQIVEAGQSRKASHYILDKLPHRIRQAVSLPSLAWKVYVGRSLGHPRFVTDPYPLYRWLQKHAPVRRDPIAPVWVVTRHADVSAMLKDPRFNKDPFADNRLPAVVREQLGIPDQQVRTADVETLSMLFLDPPQHTRVRAVFSRAFTPKMIASLRPRIQQITDKRLEKVIGTGRMDVIEAIAYPLPVVVIAELLGFPPEDYPLYKKWSDHFAAALGINPTVEQQDLAAQSRVELHAYFDRLVVQLEKKPGDNLLTALLELEREAGGLNREEIFINSALLLAAGHETTTNLIGNGIYHLLKNPRQFAMLRDDPSLIESAVEELLRFDSPVQWVSRVVREDMELGGVQLKPGAILLGCLGAANRDPLVFADPDRLDLRRSDNKHLSFGSGVHFCLGAALARMEAQIAIGTILQKLPALRLVQRKIRWKKGLIFRAIERLDVAWVPKS